MPGDSERTIVPQYTAGQVTDSHRLNGQDGSMS